MIKKLVQRVKDWHTKRRDEYKEEQEWKSTVNDEAKKAFMEEYKEQLLAAKIAQAKEKAKAKAASDIKPIHEKIGKHAVSIAKAATNLAEGVIEFCKPYPEEQSKKKGQKTHKRKPLPKQRSYFKDTEWEMDFGINE